jgi:hypothetical protein
VCSSWRINIKGNELRLAALNYYYYCLENLSRTRFFLVSSYFIILCLLWIWYTRKLDSFCINTLCRLFFPFHICTQLPCYVIGNVSFLGVFKWRENNLGYLFLRTITFNFLFLVYYNLVWPDHLNIVNFCSCFSDLGSKSTDNRNLCMNSGIVVWPILTMSPLFRQSSGSQQNCRFRIHSVSYKNTLHLSSNQS